MVVQTPKAGQSRQIDAEAIRYTRGLSEVAGQPVVCPGRDTPQSEPLDERQVANSAGGHSYPVDDMTRLQRFLILGSEGGSYYASDRKLTLENAAAVKRCIQQQGLATIGGNHQDQPVGPGSQGRPPALRPGDDLDLR